jgi:hypothetical protein
VKYGALIASLILIPHPTTSAQGTHKSAVQSVTFSAPVLSNTQSNYLSQVTAGDLTHNGLADLAIVNIILGAASIYSVGAGTGFFPIWKFAPSPLGPGSVVLADVNGDGNLDIITSDNLYGSLTIGFGDGQGNFPSSETLNTSDFYGPLAVADLTNNGIADIIGLGFGNVAVVLGTGNGQFQPEIQFGTGGVEPWALAIADVNHDGVPDLIIANIGNYSSNHKPYGSVTVLLGRGDGRFQAPRRYFAGRNPSSIALADFNGDGNVDIAVTNLNLGLSILLGDGKGGFSAPAALFPGLYAGSVVAADFNGDGKQDLALITGSPGQVTLLLGNGDGTFQAPQFFVTGINAIQVVAADFNGDGKPDVATIDSNELEGKVSVLLNTTP